MTRKQSLSSAWKIHRGGRVTASISKMAYGANIDSPSKTFLNTIMQYTKSIKVAASKYGAKYFARKDFADYFKLHHKNVLVAETGLNLNASFPYFGASPDGFAFFPVMVKAFWK